MPATTDRTWLMEGRQMHVVQERCCGLDGHKRTVTACVLVTEGARARKTVRTFRTLTPD